jgi:serine/threonine-protein kinase
MQIGQTFAHYRIIDRVGSGETGELYRAMDHRLRRMVALKFFSPARVADEQARERFMQEARAASGLDHPNICMILGIEETPEGQLFVSREWYGGETLRNTIARGPLRMEDAIGIARQVAEGLARAHDEGITHRDLHPGNILITPQRAVKILDFGVAALTEATRPKRPGVKPGRLTYLSPEQLRGEEGGASSDIWAFGVMLFEMLAGRIPMQGEELSTLRKEVPGSLVQLCKQCLQANPDERLQSMHDVLGMLGHWPFDTSRVASPLFRKLQSRYFVPLLVGVILLIVILYLLLR